MRRKSITPFTLISAILVTVVLTLALAAGGLALTLGKAGLGVAEAMVLIHTQFVGEGDVQKAADVGMSNLVAALDDRWSYYVDAEGYKRLQENQDNAYIGLGCTVSYPEGEGLLVDAVTPGGPADQAGVRAGDLILEVDGVRMEGENRLRASEYTRGPDGSLAELLLRRAGGARQRVNVVRGRVYEQPVSYELMEDGTAYLKLKNFNRRVADESIAAVDDLVARGAKRLVFDLRDNGGGYLDELTRLLDHLLPEGVIFRASDRAGRTSLVRSDENCIDLPMAVLVNGNTYSAAEFFAAELQEMDKGVIVGTPTFGKGYSQQTFPLLSGGAINISTARYFTGNGVSLIGTGLTLDRQVEAGESYVPGETENDPQLRAALELLDSGG